MSAKGIKSITNGNMLSFEPNEPPVDGFGWPDVLVPDPDPPVELDATGERVDETTAEVADNDTDAVPSSTVM